jgi:uncharacterized protein YggE
LSLAQVLVAETDASEQKLRNEPEDAMRLSHLALALMLAASPLAAQEAPPRAITVTGVAEAEAVPDMATVTAGVETRADTAAAALAANSEAMTAVFAALEAAGVARRDMQTSQLSINPVYEPYREGAEEAQRVVGYDASNMVTVRVRAIDSLGAVVDAVTTAGSNRLYGVAFEVSDPKPHLDTARQKAVEDARARAELFAGAAGVSLGPVLSIREAVQMPGPVMMRAQAAMAESAPPVAEGTVTLQAQVEIVYGIE